MPKHDIDQFSTPIDLAVTMAEKQMAHFINQVVKPREPQRRRRLGELEAEPIIQNILDRMAEETGYDNGTPS